jgi:hypothetical protein
VTVAICSHTAKLARKVKTDEVTQNILFLIRDVLDASYALCRSGNAGKRCWTSPLCEPKAVYWSLHCHILQATDIRRRFSEYTRWLHPLFLRCGATRCGPSPLQGGTVGWHRTGYPTKTSPPCIIVGSRLRFVTVCS